MQYGICHLSVVSVHSSANDGCEMLSQLLYGEHFKVLEIQKEWSRIRIAFDKCEGWICNNQYTLITETNYQELQHEESVKVVTDLVSFVQKEDYNLVPLLLGSSLVGSSILDYQCDTVYSEIVPNKSRIVDTAILYLNAPFLKGGKTPFGIDASGLTQMVYKINGFSLFRTSIAQSAQGEALSFIEESEAGDLAFFDNKEGIIDHVGIIMENNYIIHVYGKVRVDRIDHTGIFNADLNRYTHSLRVIKKIA